MILCYNPNQNMTSAEKEVKVPAKDLEPQKLAEAVRRGFDHSMNNDLCPLVMTIRVMGLDLNEILRAPNIEEQLDRKIVSGFASQEQAIKKTAEWLKTKVERKICVVLPGIERERALAEWLKIVKTLAISWSIEQNRPPVELKILNESLDGIESTWQKLLDLADPSREIPYDLFIGNTLGIFFDFS